MSRQFIQVSFVSVWNIAYRIYYYPKLTYYIILYVNYIYSEIIRQRKLIEISNSTFLSTQSEHCLLYFILFDRKERGGIEHAIISPLDSQDGKKTSFQLTTFDCQSSSVATLSKWKSALEVKGRNFQISIPPGHSPLFTGHFSLGRGMIHFPPVGVPPRKSRKNRVERGETDHESPP